MPIWDQFKNDDDLYKLLDCKDFKEAKQKFKNKYNKNSWQTYARENYQAENIPDLTTETFFKSLNDANNLTILILLTIIGSITVELIPLSILTAVTVPLSMGVTAAFFYYSYRRQQSDNLQMQKKMDFAEIRILCADEYIRRKKLELAAAVRQGCKIPAGTAAASNKPEPFQYSGKHKDDKIQPALGFGLLTWFVSFCTYYSGLAILLHSFGVVAASSLMLGPIGISIAIAVTLGIGIYLGYRQYHALVKLDHVAQFQDYQKGVLKDKREECHQMKKQCHEAKIALAKDEESERGVNFSCGLQAARQHKPVRKAASDTVIPSAESFSSGRRPVP